MLNTDEADDKKANTDLFYLDPVEYIDNRIMQFIARREMALGTLKVTPSPPGDRIVFALNDTDKG